MGKNDSASHPEMQATRFLVVTFRDFSEQGCSNPLSGSSEVGDTRMQSTVEWTVTSSTHRPMSFN
jgi:hypothetical protein